MRETLLIKGEKGCFCESFSTMAIACCIYGLHTGHKRHGGVSLARRLCNILVPSGGTCGLFWVFWLFSSSARLFGPVCTHQAAHLGLSTRGSIFPIGWVTERGMKDAYGPGLTMSTDFWNERENVRDDCLESK